MPREFAIWAQEQGADINFRDEHGLTPIFYVARMDGDVSLLIELGAEIETVTKNGCTPLHTAAAHERAKAVRTLLKAGAKIDAQTFDKNYQLLAAMYRDGYFPNFLVDKVKGLIQNVVNFLETGEKDSEKIQKKFDEMTLAINDLEEEFEENDSELETVARDSIGESVAYILKWFDIDLDVEDAIGERDW